VWRFDGLPRDYYLDWMRVAHEEAHHFTLLRTELRAMGHDYGDFPTHTGLWDMAERTRGEVLALEHQAPKLRAPFNLEAGARAGFSTDELVRL
jgi:uncharacterized ferritin-like protein (DUF455 family)